MDDRRFDSLVKSLAGGASRRSVLKGLLGLGGAAAIGGTLLEGPAEAARRPTPTPRPIRCPGNQIPDNGVCTCPPGLSQCNPGVGPACCNDTAVAPGSPTYSECCDNACCNGTCYGEELCCRTNSRAGGLPPTNRICDTTSGPECCLFSDACCLIDGCCAGGCYGGSTGQDSCCPIELFCPNASGNSNRCCAAGELCCAGGTDDNNCAECCTDADCPEGICRSGACVCLGLGEHCTQAQDCCQNEGATTCRDTIQCNAAQDTICCRPVGSMCADRCDCCGTIPCEGGRCCLGEGMGACNGDSSNCCAGLECVGDPGDDSCQPPEPPCTPLGDICDYQDPHCCDSFSFTQCNPIYPAKDNCPVSVNSDYCCRTPTGACSETCDCCFDLVCENSACCQPEGLFCNDSSECCGGLSCMNSSCQPCAALQDVCTTSSSCCDPSAACAEVADCGFSGATCCHGAGGSCSSECDCCGSVLACQDSICCLAEGAPCDATANCCGELVCELVCVQPDAPLCVNLGDACDDSTPACCDGDCFRGQCCLSDADECALDPDHCCPSCSSNGAACEGGVDCCDGCCIANFASPDDWLKVCSDAGFSGPDAEACAQAIIAQNYPGTCLFPAEITFQGVPVSLPCFD